MSGHTPGSWKAKGAGIYADGVLIGTTGDDTDSEEGIAEQTANARLMAAAPDMLEALKSSVKAFDRFGIDSPPQIIAMISNAEGCEP